MSGLNPDYILPDTAPPPCPHDGPPVRLLNVLLLFGSGQISGHSPSTEHIWQMLPDLKADNQRLKDENGALIRVISKLSK
ncbi:Protein phosphatase 1 regulatory subunit 12A [Liparis tanakae]|uniref:Protein phosphatase 1 regulatory subunit 12A n=1 Tax=Liparis tanakae TaxID=230148 RepID=A0A4Z2GU43_9TELE|nr:Protein phosphatase 1 regulatory subunit 12A [Liparis tanakae]